MDEEALKELTFDAMYEDIKWYAPSLYKALSEICRGPGQDRNMLKDSKCCLMIFINALANQMSHFNDRVQKLICIYFKAQSVPKSVYHMAETCGIITSYQWSVDALANIAEAAMDKAVSIFDAQPCLIMYDNIRLPFPVKH
ncbi:hypothetical protein FS749_009135 [Ceratobasidium sp. UAMH 11750]|nr:hypothetical protein FS749_009135 [Ceratobasidium sp. UAMH 11750]